MPNIITIKKGLTLNLKGKAAETQLAAAQRTESYAVVPDDYIGFVPKVIVHPGRQGAGRRCSAVPQGCA